MASMRERRYNFLVKNGFLPVEARDLSRTSRAGMRAPYFQAMIRSRRSLFNNALRYGWTERQYRDYIRELYTSRGFVRPDKLGRYRPDVWSMLREYEERAHRRGEEYESPWKKRARRKSTRKQEAKRTTRKEALQSWIKQLDKSIERTASESRKAQLRNQRDNLKRMLDSMS